MGCHINSAAILVFAENIKEWKKQQRSCLTDGQLLVDNLYRKLSNFSKQNVYFG